MHNKPQWTVATRGRTLQNGAKFLRMHGQDVPIRVHIETLDSLSAHADRTEIVKWLGCFTHSPRQVFVVHGEPNATLRDEWHWNVAVSNDGEKIGVASDNS